MPTDRAIGDAWLVTKGLNDGDRVIVRGVRSVKPGDEATAHEVTIALPDMLANTAPQSQRYDGLPSVEILGEPVPGLSSGTALKAMAAAAKKLPKGFGYEWTGLSYEEARPVRAPAEPLGRGV